MATGRARLSAEITGAAAPGNSPGALVESGVVKSVVEGYGVETTITVTWRDRDVPASYLASYSPVAGDVVALIYRSPGVLVLGRIIGLAKEE